MPVLSANNTTKHASHSCQANQAAAPLACIASDQVSRGSRRPAGSLYIGRRHQRPHSACSPRCTEPVSLRVTTRMVKLTQMRRRPSRGMLNHRTSLMDPLAHWVRRRTLLLCKSRLSNTYASKLPRSIAMGDTFFNKLQPSDKRRTGTYKLAHLMQL